MVEVQTQDTAHAHGGTLSKSRRQPQEGKHRDGQGLQFEVKGGSRRWTFSYMLEGRQREIAIGK